MHINYIFQAFNNLYIDKYLFKIYLKIRRTIRYFYIQKLIKNIIFVFKKMSPSK